MKIQEQLMPEEYECYEQMPLDDIMDDEEEPIDDWEAWKREELASEHDDEE